MIRMWSRWMWVGIVLWLCGCASDGTRDVREGRAKMVTTTQNLPPPDTTAANGAYEGVSEYRIGPMDVIEISVYQLEELSRSVRVNSKGMISLPLLGPLQAAGKTVPELESEITERLAKDFLQEPQVTLYVREYTSQRITVEGAVKSPGIYPLSGKTSLLQAIVIAGGVTEFANPRGIIIFRVIEGKKMAAVFDLRDIRGGNAEDPQVYGDDLIVIDESGTKSAFRSFLQSMPVIGLFQAL
ncbi:MAG: polysaccharide biosynthesis/export family protein [Lysobacterales bacterium]